MRTFRPCAVAFGAMLATLSLTACDTFESHETKALSEPMSISLRASNTNVAVGDTASVVAETRNFAGNTELKWSTTGGKIEAADDNRVARVRFDSAGTYTVTAKALVNGVVVDSQSVDIHVKELVPAQPVRSDDLHNNNADVDRDRDLNRDGVRDNHDNDLDHDGIPNDRDSDRDGDGIPNDRDADPDHPGS